MQLFLIVSDFFFFFFSFVLYARYHRVNARDAIDELSAETMSIVVAPVHEEYNAIIMMK